MTDLEDAVQTAVDEATNSETFDVLEFFSGASLPEDDVKLYADSAAAFELRELLDKQKEQARLAKTQGFGITDEVEYIDEDRIQELHDKLLASEVTFHLRGVAPAAQKALEKHLKATLPYKEGDVNELYNEQFNATIVAKSIQSVRNRAGQKDETPWDADRVLELSANLQPSEFAKLWEGAFQVTYIGAAIDQAVSADFS